MNEYWLVVPATLGIATTLFALTGLFFVAGLRWALVDCRWKRTRPDLVVGGLKSWLSRAASVARHLVRGGRFPGRDA